MPRLPNPYPGDAANNAKSEMKTSRLVTGLMLGLVVWTGCPSPGSASGTPAEPEADISRRDGFQKEWFGLEGFAGGGKGLMAGALLSLFPFRHEQFYMDPVQGGFICWTGIYGPYGKLNTAIHLMTLGMGMGVVVDIDGSHKHELRFGPHATIGFGDGILIPSLSGIQAYRVYNVSNNFRTTVGLRFLVYPPVALATFGFRL